MKKKLPILLAAAAALGGFAFPLHPQAAGLDGCASDAMIVFDGSGSMSEMGFNKLNRPRIFAARQAMRRAIPSIAELRRLGLIVYGPGQGSGRKERCSNVELRFAPTANAAPLILGAVDALQPSGETPLTGAVAKAAQVLGGEGEIVLVTDGKETCGGRVCALADSLAIQAPGLRVHVIGFVNRGDVFDWDDARESDFTEVVSVTRCLADRTGGRYVTTETVEDLALALDETIGCPLYAELAQ